MWRFNEGPKNSSAKLLRPRSTRYNASMKGRRILRPNWRTTRRARFNEGPKTPNGPGGRFNEGPKNSSAKQQSHHRPRSPAGFNEGPILADPLHERASMKGRRILRPKRRHSFDEGMAAKPQFADSAQAHRRASMKGRRILRPNRSRNLLGLTSGFGSSCECSMRRGAREATFSVVKVQMKSVLQGCERCPGVGA